MGTILQLSFELPDEPVLLDPHLQAILDRHPELDDEPGQPGLSATASDYRGNGDWPS